MAPGGVSAKAATCYARGRAETRAHFSSDPLLPLWLDAVTIELDLERNRAREAVKPRNAEGPVRAARRLDGIRRGGHRRQRRTDTGAGRQPVRHPVAGQGPRGRARDALGSVVEARLRAAGLPPGRERAARPGGGSVAQGRPARGGCGTSRPPAPALAHDGVGGLRPHPAAGRTGRIRRRRGAGEQPVRHRLRARNWSARGCGVWCCR